MKERIQEAEGFLQEFIKFISRGNIVELAVGLTVGTAFTKLVSSIVNNLIMPVVGLFLKGESFRDLFLALDGSSYATLADAEAAGAAILKYGVLVADLLDFLIIAFAIFVVVKVITKFRKKEDQAVKEKSVKDSDPIKKVKPARKK